MKKIIFVGLFLIITMPMLAQTISLADAVGQDHAQRLMKDGYLYTEDSMPVVKFVVMGALKEQMQRYIKELNANFSLEFLYFVANDRRFPKQSSDEIIIKLLNLTSLNHAYMIRNDKEEALFSNVEVFKDLTNRKVKPLQPVVALPFSYTQYMNVKDSKFGKIDYRVEYQATESVIIMSLLNESNLSYMLRKIANARGMRLTFMQQELKDGILYVGHISANIQNLEKAQSAIHLPSFFSRRVEGLKGWYFKQVYDVKVDQGIYPAAI